MSELPVVPSFARQQNRALAGFYACAILFAVAATLTERSAEILRIAVGSVAVISAGLGVFSLYTFFKVTDEFRQAINRRAAEFAFVSSLVASIVLALLRTFGMHESSPYLLPAVMVGLWSVGLFFASRRFE